ncbi:hypothetical protein BC830DRAFT_887003 [Chytriomyces sp. MP71]|nr:hypothetical protein BC830DRAFT_887003 [Chytriomyces sp. MP71]
MILTESLILSKAKGFSRTAASIDISQIQSINLWGQNLTDISCLARLPFLQVVSLPVNRIHDLSAFAQMQHLTELYLRKNDISDPRQLMYLTRLPLEHLWISENPMCSKIPNYRLTLILLFPNLSKLDDKEITDRERRDAARLAEGESVSPTSSNGSDAKLVSPNKPSPPPVLKPATVKQAPPPSIVAIPNISKRQTIGSSREINEPFIHHQKQQHNGSIQFKSPPPHDLDFSDEEEYLRAQLAQVQSQRRRTVTESQHLSRSYDERPISSSYHTNNRMSSSYEDHLVGQGVIASFDSKAQNQPRLAKGRANKTSSAKPSYSSQILQDKKFQDHLTVGNGTKVVQVPIATQNNTRKHNPSRANATDHLANAAVTVTADPTINTDYRRRSFGPYGKGADHVAGGAAASVAFLPHKEHDYRMRSNDIHAQEGHVAGSGMIIQNYHQEYDARIPHFDLHTTEGHVHGSGMAVQEKAEYHDPRIAQFDMHQLEAHVRGSGGLVHEAKEYHEPRLGLPKRINEHVQGSGMKVVGDEDLEFPVIHVDTIKASQQQPQSNPKPPSDDKIKPQWLKSTMHESKGMELDKGKSHSLLLAVLSIVKDLDRTSLQMLQHEVGRLLE